MRVLERSSAEVKPASKAGTGSGLGVIAAVDEARSRGRRAVASAVGEVAPRGGVAVTPRRGRRWLGGVAKLPGYGGGMAMATTAPRGGEHGAVPRMVGSTAEFIVGASYRCAEAG